MTPRSKSRNHRARNDWNATSDYGVEKIGPSTWAVVHKATDIFVSEHSTRKAALAAAEDMA